MKLHQCQKNMITTTMKPIMTDKESVIPGLITDQDGIEINNREVMYIEGINNIQEKTP